MSILEPAIELCGDSSLLLTWTANDDAAVESAVHAAHACLARAALPPVTGLVPGWDSLGVNFDPLLISAAELRKTVLVLLASEVAFDLQTPRVVTLQVSFLTDDAPDLNDVARACGVSVKDCVRLIEGTELRVRMLGFAPGFPYLTGLPDVLRVPRRATPRLRVPAGSLAIAGGLAGIYPQPSPGGWQLVGRVQQSLFSPHASPPCLLRAGDRVRFVQATAGLSGEGEVAG
ncbi:MAG: hypothetical protein RLZZ458_2898 [Planctomycetota bacterium]